MVSTLTLGLRPALTRTHHFPQALVKLAHNGVQPGQLGDHAAQLLTGALAHLGPLVGAPAHVLRRALRAQAERLCVFADGIDFC